MKFNNAPMSMIKAAIASLSLSVIFLSAVFISGNMPSSTGLTFDSNAQLAQVCSAPSIAAGTCGNFVYSQTTGSQTPGSVSLGSATLICTTYSGQNKLMSSGTICPWPVTDYQPLITDRVVGYMGIYAGAVYGCENTNNGPVNTGNVEVPIYARQGVMQGWAWPLLSCINYIRLTSTDKVQLVCNTSIPPQIDGGPIFSGPGTFTPNTTDACQSLTSNSVNNIHAAWPIFKGNIVKVTALATPPTTLSISPSSAIPGSPVVVSGNFALANNSVTFSSAGRATVIINNLPSDGFSFSFSLPNDMLAGSYQVSVITAGKALSPTLPFTVIPDAPSNVIATLSTTGKVNISWAYKSANLGFNIERAVSPNYNDFKVVGSTAAGVMNYVDDIDLGKPTPSQEVYRIQARTMTEARYSDYSAKVTVSNCLKISGNGPVKIVFSREGYHAPSLRTSLDSFYKNAVAIVNKGFSIYDPLKSRLNQFSFYVDMHEIDETSLTSYENGYYTTDANSTIAQGSSCGQDASEYVFMINNDWAHTAWVKGESGIKSVVFMNMAVMSHRIDNMPIIAVHETGHALGYLNDEYLSQNNHPDSDNDYMVGTLQRETNCTLHPENQFTYDDGNGLKWYGGNDYSGCTYGFSSVDYSRYYRPTDHGMMNSAQLTGDKFNVISCGYLLSAIAKEPIDKIHAQTHWAECMNMDIDKSGVPSVASTPTNIKISSTALSPGDPTITGSGFTPKGNTVKLINLYNSSQTYLITDIASLDRKMISFIIPTSTPSGSYTLKVGALNSPWSAPINVTVYPKINISGVSCMVVSGANASGTALIPGYRFSGSPAGGLLPLSYTLNNVPVTNSTVSLNNINVLSYMSGGVWTPNVFVTVPNAKMASGAVLKIMSKDGQTATTTCTEIAPTAPTSEPMEPTLQTPMVTGSPVAAPMIVRTTRVATLTAISTSTSPSTLPAVAPVITASTTQASAPQIFTPVVTPVVIATSTVVPLAPTPTYTSDTFTLNVDYSHFASEEAQYRYTSVYSTTGTKSVAITVFKFNDSATMTADQVKTKLATLGYRPATLNEMYALGQAGKWNVIGLGTSMGSYNMYPITQNGAGNGLYSISTTASYSTQTYRFAAVKLTGASSMNDIGQTSSFTASIWDALSSILYAWKK